MRQWTSATGSTLEAEMVDVEGSHVFLKSSNNKEFKIRISMLSDADQDYIQKNRTPLQSSPAEKSSASQNPKKQFAYQKPVPLRALPDTITLQNPNNARYLLIQYGPKETDLIHVAFDPSETTAPAEAAYIWSPSLSSFKTPKRVLGQTRKIEGTKAYVYTAPVSTSFGEIGVNGNVQITYGASQWWLIHATGSFTLKTGHQTSSLQLGGYVYDYSSGAGTPQEAKPIRFLGPVYFYLTSNPTGMTTVRLWMNKFWVVPGEGMDHEVVLTYHKKEGKEIDDHDLEITEDMLFNSSPSPYVYYSTTKFSAGNEYQVQAKINLGPVFGVQEKEVIVKK